MPIILGLDRHQITFSSLEEAIATDNEVRFIDAIMGKAENNETGNILTIQRNSHYTGGQLSPIDADNSGTLSYVSIEYAGQNYTGDNYKGALLLNSVGEGTIMHHVQVLNPLNAGLTLLGGKVNAQDIYIQNAEKEDVYIEYGYRGILTDILAIKNPTMQTIATDAKGIYISNHSGQVMNTPFTNPTIDAFTLIGPQQCEEDDNDRSSGIEFNNNAHGNCSNGIVSGYFNSIKITDLNSAQNTNSGLGLQYVALGNNQNLVDAYSPWPMGACENSAVNWILNNVCDNIMVDENALSLEYDGSICNDYCDEHSSPIFTIGSSNNIPSRNSSSLKIGVLQEEPVFTWVQACPAATCCEAIPHARILPLEAYPNPVQHTVTMVVPDVKDQQVKVQVIEMATGRIFYQQIQAKEAQLNIDMSKLPQGNYKVQMVTEQATYQTTIHKD